MRDRPELVLNDLTRRVGMLEIEIHGSGDSIARLLERIRHQVEENSTARETVNELENRLLILEERSRSSPETQKLKELATLLVKLPGGLWGPFYALIVVDTLIALAIEIMGPANLIRNALGL